MASFENTLPEGMYLIKVPNVVYNHITKLPTSALIGKVTANTTKDHQSKKWKVLLEGAIAAKRFDMIVDKSHEMFTFKEKKNKIKEIDMIGRFIASDQDVSDYVTNKTHKEEEDKKKMTMIETSKSRPLNEGIIKMSDHQFYATNDNSAKAILQKNRKDKNLKKTRKDKDDLKNDIFDLFSEKKFWTTKELVDKLDQPENYLKEVLSEICNYIKSGPKKGSFELKEQYELKEDE